MSAQPTTVTAQGISKVILVTDAAPFTVTTITQEWVDITGASAMVRVPTVWRSGLIMLRFSGDLGSCESNCAVRILVDGIEANPAVGESGVFQGVANPDVIERSIVVSTTGTHTVQVQVFVNANSFTLNDWSLVAELARVS